MEEQMTVEFLNTYLGKLNEEVAEIKKENVFLKAKVAEREMLLNRAAIQLKEAQDMINELKETQEVIISQDIQKTEINGAERKTKNRKAAG